MPYRKQPTHTHSRKRAAASLARHGDPDQAARVGRVPLELIQAWVAGDAEFRTLYRKAERRVQRQAFRALMAGLSRGQRVRP